MKRRDIKLCIYAISIVGALNTVGLTVIISSLVETFPEHSVTDIQMLQTLPNLFSVLAAALTGLLLVHFSDKKIVLTSFALLFLTGILCFFISEYSCLFWTRILAGFAFGVQNPLKMSILSAHFSGQEKAQILGYQSAFSAFAGFLYNLLTGWIIQFGYQFYFLIYSVALLAFILFLFKYKTSLTPLPKTKRKSKIISHYTLGICFSTALYALCNSAYNTNISLHIHNYYPNSTLLTGFISSIHPLAAAIMGLSFGYLYAHFKNRAAPLTILIGTTGCLLIFLFPENLLILLFFSACMGAALVGNGQASSLLLINSVSAEYTADIIALNTLFTSLIVFFSPQIYHLLTEILFHNFSTRLVFLCAACISIFAALLTYLIIRKKENY